MGRHAGIAHFTVGQRRGLGVAAGERRYVVDVDAASATVTIGQRDDLLRTDIRVRGMTWVDAPTPPDRELEVQVRAHGQPLPGRLEAPDRVVLRDAQPRVAPGQVVALYEGNVLVGGGIAA